MNENNENKLPEEKEPSEHKSGEDTKAFNWEWSDSSDKESADDKTPDELDEGQNEADAEDTRASDSSANAAQEDISGDADSIDSTDGSSDAGSVVNTDTGNNTEEVGDTLDTSRRSRSDRTLQFSCILSACSLILLVLFSLSLLLGIFPVNGKEVVFIGVSDSGATEPDVDASPELLEDFLNSVVIIKASSPLSASSAGTGVIISEDGYIVTNYHIIAGHTDVTVQLYGEKVSVGAEVLGFHESDDIAVLKIDRKGLRAAPFADSDTVRYGETVYAIGCPEGTEYAWSISRGVVSCPLRELMIYDSEGVLEMKLNMVQTDAQINHGNSGGPLINVRGEIVGINTRKLTWSSNLDSGSNQIPVEGMGFALPADGVAIDVASIIEKGHADNVSSGISIPRPLIGITGVGVEAKTYYKNIITNGQSGIEKVTKEYAESDPENTFYAAVSGVYVSAVSSGSDAANHLRKGDIIIEINGSPVSIIYDVMDIVNQHNGGDIVSVTYYRDGKHHTVDLTLHTSKDLG